MNTPYGYCAVIMPQLSAYQAFFIFDDPDMRRTANEMFDKLSYLPESQWFGALQAAMCEFFVEGRHTAVVAAALVVGERLGHRYFAVKGHRSAGGTHTTFMPLVGASSADEARNLVHRIPEVQIIEMRNLLNPPAAPGDGGNRRVTLH